MLLTLPSMTGPRASTPVEPTEHPLRTALARGERARAESAPTLQHLLATPDRSLISEAVVAQVRGMLRHLARQLIDALTPHATSEPAVDALLTRLQGHANLRAHCQALALEWRLAQILEEELALDPVLSPQLQEWVSQAGAVIGSLAMAALAAQARFAQAQRRMELPLMELPAELFHDALSAGRDAVTDDGSGALSHAVARLRADYDEGATRLALLSRLSREATPDAPRALTVEGSGVALWLSVLADRSGEDRDRTACAAADPYLGRLLLTLRAAGVAPAEAERQVLKIQPDATLPRGLGDIGTREAAQWLLDVRA